MLVTVALHAVVTVALAGLGLNLSALNASDASVATFVGSETCDGCHRAQADLWHTSQHKHAMDHATDKSVLGDFSDATFDYYGVKSRFFREDGKFFVETDGPDGKLAVFEVKYTFGNIRSQRSTLLTSIVALVATAIAKVFCAWQSLLLPKMRDFTIRSVWHSCG